MNRFLSKLKYMKCFDEDPYSRLHTSGSANGMIYGLPPPNFSLKLFQQPITKPLIKHPGFLSRFTTNQYTFSISYVFSRTTIWSLSMLWIFSRPYSYKKQSKIVSISFSLATSQFQSLRKISYKNSCNLPCKSRPMLNSSSAFDGVYYKQVEGLEMGVCQDLTVSQ